MTFGLLGCIATVAVAQLLAPGHSIQIAGLVIMGLAAYLLVLRMRRPHEIPKWVGAAMVSTIALTAYIGFFGVAFIDNAAHAGGAAMGALLGIATIPAEGESQSPDVARALDALGWVAAAALVAGAVMTDVILLAARMR